MLATANYHNSACYGTRSVAQKYVATLSDGTQKHYWMHQDGSIRLYSKNGELLDFANIVTAHHYLERELEGKEPQQFTTSYRNEVLIGFGCVLADAPEFIQDRYAPVGATDATYIWYGEVGCSWDAFTSPRELVDAFALAVDMQIDGPNNNAQF